MIDFTRTETADAWAVARLRKELSQWLRANVPIDAVRLNDVLLAVNEALTNSAEFAYPGTEGTVTLQARYDASSGGLFVDVSDHGTWRHVDPGAQPNTRGRGIPLMRALADSASISPQTEGTVVHLEFRDCSRVPAEACATSA
jgi:anti-sigma regulatory factor (Ser/Thr protein kinase)